MCYGPTAAISRLLHGVQSEWLTGLPITRRPGGARGRGPAQQDVTDFAGNTSFQGPGDAYFTMGHGGPATARAALGAAGEMMGKLSVNFFGGLEELGDLTAYEGTLRNPTSRPVAPTRSASRGQPSRPGSRRCPHKRRFIASTD